MEDNNARALKYGLVDSVKHVFEYFTERTPRSHFERHETSLVWNYKYADDVEFGRLQARDMMQHLWTGPICNSSVDVVQGKTSIEGAAMDRILGEIVHSKPIHAPIDYVLCIGHFLGKFLKLLQGDKEATKWARLQVHASKGSTLEGFEILDDDTFSQS